MILEEYKIMEGFTGKATDQKFTCTCSGNFRLLFLNPTNNNLSYNQHSKLFWSTSISLILVNVTKDTKLCVN